MFLINIISNLEDLKANAAFRLEDTPEYEAVHALDKTINKMLKFLNRI